MLFLGRGEYGRNTLWHVTSPSCRYDPLSSLLDKMDKIDLEIGHHKNLDKITRKNRRVIREACAGLQGTPYDYTELFFHLLQELELSDKDLSDPKLFVCSSGLRYVLSKGGLWFCRKDPLPSPQDIRKDKNYVCDWQWGDAPREA